MVTFAYDTEGPEKMLSTVKSLPDDASVEDAVERLILLSKIENGIVQADAGQLIPDDEMKERKAKWLE